MAITTFLANVTDFIQNRQFSEEKFKNIVSFVGIIGFYQYLVSSYIAPILKAPNINSVYFIVFFLLIVIILGLFFLREIRGLIPEFLTDYIKDYIESRLHTREKLQGSQRGTNSDINKKNVS